MIDQNIIGILGIESLPDDQKMDLVDKASALVEKRIVVRMLNALDDKKRSEFENLVDSENQEAINLFLEQNAPKLGDWISQEVAKVKEELSTLTKSI